MATKHTEPKAEEQPLMKCGLRTSDINAIGNYLATRIHQNCKYLQTTGKDDQYHDGPDECELDVAMGFDPRKDFGVFRHIIRKLKIHLKVWKLDKKDLGELGQRYVVNIHFSYTHPDGGSNGHDVAFKLWYNTFDHTLTEESTEYWERD